MSRNSNNENAKQKSNKQINQSKVKTDDKKIKEDICELPNQKVTDNKKENMVKDDNYSQNKNKINIKGKADISGNSSYFNSLYEKSTYSSYNDNYSSSYSSNYNYYYHEKIDGIFGFKNSKFYNNCFMNSSLQNFIHCEKFKILVHSIKDNFLFDKPLTKEFKFLVDQIYKGEDELDASKIKEELSKVEEKYKYNEQNDANEFITIFLNQLLFELKGIGVKEYIKGVSPINPLENKAFEKLENRFFEKNKSFLLNLFYGRLKREYICKNGHIFSIKFNNYNTLILPQPEQSNDIIDLLNLYQEEKQIKDTIFCEKCQKEVKYSIKTIIYDIPEYFILCLEKEAIYSSHGLNYPKELHSKTFMEKGNEKYILNSLIVYSGNRKTGHYIAKCCQDNQWYYISDNYYRRIDDEEINDQNAIILFYYRNKTKI